MALGDCQTKHRHRDTHLTDIENETKIGLHRFEKESRPYKSELNYINQKPISWSNTTNTMESNSNRTDPARSTTGTSKYDTFQNSESLKKKQKTKMHRYSTNDETSSCSQTNKDSVVEIWRNKYGIRHTQNDSDNGVYKSNLKPKKIRKLIPNDSSSEIVIVVKNNYNTSLPRRPTRKTKEKIKNSKSTISGTTFGVNRPQEYSNKASDLVTQKPTRILKTIKNERLPYFKTIPNIPFVAAKSTTNSHNIGVNIQQILSVLKRKQLGNKQVLKSSLKEENIPEMLKKLVPEKEFQLDGRSKNGNKMDKIQLLEKKEMVNKKPENVNVVTEGNPKFDSRKLKKVLVFLQEDFQRLTKKYETLQQETCHKQYNKERLAADIAQTEQILEQKMEEIKLVITLYKEVLYLRKELKSKRAFLSCEPTAQQPFSNTKLSQNKTGLKNLQNIQDKLSMK